MSIDGQRFRKTYNVFDEVAALRRERQTIDLVKTVKSQEETDAALRRILGSSFKPEYSTMLPYIQPSQFSDFEDLGKGSFGAVSAATWNRPKSIASISDSKIPVALKRFQEKYQTAKSLSLFLQEVRNFRVT
jgi:hypothetical protein